MQTTFLIKTVNTQQDHQISLQKIKNARPEFGAGVFYFLLTAAQFRRAACHMP